MNGKLSNLQKRRGRMRGFTLIELMIVVAVITILAAIAYPSYQNQVRKSKRADGKAMLMELAQELERCYTRFGRYDDVGCGVVVSPPVPSPGGHYLVSGSLEASRFELDATPQGDQAQDTECAILHLTSTGIQGSQGADTDVNDCW